MVIIIIIVPVKIMTEETRFITKAVMFSVEHFDFSLS